VADEKYCAIAMSGTRVVVENPLPDNPTVNNNLRNCPGTVTLSASSPGATIDWYVAVDAASSVYTGTSYTTPEIDESTTYYAQARMTSTGCLSERKPVLAEVITEGCCHAPGAIGVTFAAFNPCSHTVGSTYTLTDSRDQKTYKVKYMPDNRWWMVQDLKFGDRCNKTTFTGSTSDQLGNINSSGTYYGDCRNSPAAGAGYYYDWPAAMNKAGVYATNSTIQCSGTASGTSGTNPAACQGICPSGWHLPTIAEFTAGNSLWVQSKWCSNPSCWTSASYWEATTSGGWLDSGTKFYDTNTGIYWSSTIEAGVQIYILFITSNPYQENLERWRGALARCVMNY
jgi:uncharacterized protein (TIGR02145 family)